MSYLNSAILHLLHSYFKLRKKFIIAGYILLEMDLHTSSSFVCFFNSLVFNPKSKYRLQKIIEHSEIVQIMHMSFFPSLKRVHLS